MRGFRVLILTWNGLEHTRRCFESLRNSGIPLERVLVVDNGSTDGTVEWLRSAPCPLIENGENLGYARAVNRGLRSLGSDEAVVLLNNDVILPGPGFLEALARTAAEDAAIGVVAPRFLYPDGRLQEAGMRVQWEPFRVGHYGVHEPNAGQYGALRDVDAVSFACAWIEPRALRRIGGLDERYFCYFEDLDFCLRARQAGFRVVCDGRLECVHVENATVRENEADYSGLYASAQRALLDKWRPPPGADRPLLTLEAWLAGDVGSLAATTATALALEDAGWKVVLDCRTAWGTPLDDERGRDPLLPFLVGLRHRHQVPSSRLASLGASWSLAPALLPKGAPPLVPGVFETPEPGSAESSPMRFLVPDATPIEDVIQSGFAIAFGGSPEVELVLPDWSALRRGSSNEERWPSAGERRAAYAASRFVVALPEVGGWSVIAAEATKTGRPALAPPGATDRSVSAPVFPRGQRKLPRATPEEWASFFRAAASGKASPVSAAPDPLPSFLAEIERIDSGPADAGQPPRGATWLARSARALADAEPDSPSRTRLRSRVRDLVEGRELTRLRDLARFVLRGRLRRARPA